jgi:hypothetical protein
MRSILVLVICMALVLTGCSATSPEVTPSPQVPTAATVTSAATAAAETPQTTAYPAPSGGYPDPAASGNVYPEPAASTNGYPAPVLKEGPEFTFVEPVKASDAQVKGTGGPKVPLRLVDITAGGATLAETVVGADGNFTFEVGGKLVSGNRLGLMLGDTTGTGLKPEDFISGPGYQDMPFMGVIFDNTPIE